MDVSRVASVVPDPASAGIPIWSAPEPGRSVAPGARITSPVAGFGVMILSVIAVSFIARLS